MHSSSCTGKSCLIHPPGTVLLLPVPACTGCIYMLVPLTAWVLQSRLLSMPARSDYFQWLVPTSACVGQ